MSKSVLIKQFKNKAKQPVAGLTPEHAIYDKNGVRLDAKLGNVNLQEFRDLQQQGVNAIIAQQQASETYISGKVNEAKEEIDAKHDEVAQLSQASMIGSNTEGLEGSNVQDNLNNAGERLSELESKTGIKKVHSFNVSPETTQWEQLSYFDFFAPANEKIFYKLTDGGLFGANTFSIYFKKEDGSFVSVGSRRGNVDYVFDHDFTVYGIKIYYTKTLTESGSISISVKTDGYTGKLRKEIIAINSYVRCLSAANEPNKIINLDNYILGTSINLHIVFTETNTADNVTLNINNTGALAIEVNNEAVNANNTLYKNIAYNVFSNGYKYIAEPILNIKQSIGSNPYAVMSQKACKDSFAPISIIRKSVKYSDSEFVTKKEVSLNTTDGITNNDTRIAVNAMEHQQFSVKITDTDGVINATELPMYVKYVGGSDERLVDDSIQTTIGATNGNVSLAINTTRFFQLNKQVESISFYGDPSKVTHDGDIIIRVEVFSGGIYQDAADIVGREPIPAYYFDNNYLQNKVISINNAIERCAAHGDAFIFITDEHWELNRQKSLLLIEYIAKKTSISKLFSGGDTADSSNWAKKLFAEQLRNKFNGKIYHILGNHDYLNVATESQLSCWFDQYNMDMCGADKGRHYYYIDNNSQKIRYIILSSFKESEKAAGEGSGTSFRNGYEQEQLTWLQDVALSVDVGWSIIVMSHYFYGISATDLLSITSTNQAVIDIIDSYNGNGEVIALIQGHTHRDRITHTPVKNIPVIITTCDKNTIWYDAHGNPDLNVDRSSNTINEQAFDVVIVDKKERKITAIRIGAKAKDGIDDVAGDEVEYREVEY